MGSISEIPLGSAALMIFALAFVVFWVGFYTGEASKDRKWRSAMDAVAKAQVAAQKRSSKAGNFLSGIADDLFL